MVSTFQMLAGTALTISDSLKYTLIGLLTVFAVLAILIVLIEALHAALKEKKSEKAPVEAPVQASAPKEEKRISPGVMAEVPEASDADKDGDLIAAISAVITCVTGHSDFKIKSIKKG